MQQDYHYRFSSTKRSFTAEITGLCNKGNRFGSQKERQRMELNVQDEALGYIIPPELHEPSSDPPGLSSSSSLAQLERTRLPAASF